MKFTYTLSQLDVVTFNKLVCRRLAATTTTITARLGLFVLNALAWVAIAITTAAYASLYNKHAWLTSGLNTVLIAFGVAIAVLVASHLYRQKRNRELAFSDASWLRATQSVSATPEGLEIMTSGACTRYDWSGFTDCVEDQTMLYLFLDLTCAVLIPKNAFSTPEELSRFRSWAKSSPVPNSRNQTA